MWEQCSIKILAQVVEHGVYNAKVKSLIPREYMN